MKIIVGLGNIGKEYEKTRHNVGFMAVDKIADFYSFEKFHPEEKFEAEISAGKIKNEKIIIIKPQTFMNLSGRSVQKVLNFYNFGFERFLFVLQERSKDIRFAFSLANTGEDISENNLIKE